MQTVGNDDAGFSVDIDSASHVVKVSGWGFWDQALAESFDTIVLETYRQARRGAEVSIDMSQLKPMRDEGQQAFAHVIATLQRLAVGRINVITTSHLLKLQLLRIAREAAPKDRVHFI